MSVSLCKTKRAPKLGARNDGPVKTGAGVGLKQRD